jgi:Mrp family chromosome partitioning ATPase
MHPIWTITTFVLIDTAMAHHDHQTDVRARVPDSEVVTVALVVAKYVAPYQRIALDVMQKLQYLSGSISHSQFNGHLHV